MRPYTVSKDTASKGNDGKTYYAHVVGYANIPVWGSFGSRRHALQYAADSMGLTYAEYMEYRRKYRIK